MLIIIILLFHFSSRVSTEAFSMSTNVFSSDEVDITLHSAIHLRHPYTLDYTRGNHTDRTSPESPGVDDNGDTVTRMLASLSNNSVIEMLDAIKVNNTSQNTRIIDGSSHLNSNLLNCTNRHFRYHVTDRKTSFRLSIGPPRVYILSSNAVFCDLELSVPQGMVAVLEIIKKISTCNLDTITLLDDTNAYLKEIKALLFSTADIIFKCQFKAKHPE